MTILTQYSPEEFLLDDSLSYSFTFPAADDAAVEVYEIIDVEGTEYRYRVPITDYSLIWNTSEPRYPLRQNGVITFSRAHSSGSVAVSIERNTLIDQTADFPFRDGGFNSRAVEFALDKAMMICQEIASRKCNVVTTTPMTQEIVFRNYGYFPEKHINFQMQKTFDILAEIDASGDDCSETPGDA